MLEKSRITSEKLRWDNLFPRKRFRPGKLRSDTGFSLSGFPLSASLLSGASLSGAELVSITLHLTELDACCKYLQLNPEKRKVEWTVLAKG